LEVAVAETKDVDDKAIGIIVPQSPKMIRGLRNHAFAGIVKDDRYILAGQPRLGFEHDPAGRHVGGEQRMARRKGGLVPDIEQCDFIAQQQRAADLRRGDGGDGHGMAGLDSGAQRMTTGSMVRHSER
jgi:hypothetical protein